MIATTSKAREKVVISATPISSWRAPTELAPIGKSCIQESSEPEQKSRKLEEFHSALRKWSFTQFLLFGIEKNASSNLMLELLAFDCAATWASSTKFWEYFSPTTEALRPKDNRRPVGKIDFCSAEQNTWADRVVCRRRSRCRKS